MLQALQIHLTGEFQTKKTEIFLHYIYDTETKTFGITLLAEGMAE